MQLISIRSRQNRSDHINSAATQTVIHLRRLHKTFHSADYLFTKITDIIEIIPINTLLYELQNNKSLFIFWIAHIEILEEMSTKHTIRFS